MNKMNYLMNFHSGNMFRVKYWIALAILTAYALCEEDIGCYNEETKGNDYRGTKTTTEDGKTCDTWYNGKYNEDGNWDNKFTKEDGIENEDRPDCRNPDPDNHDEPWCYVEDSATRANCGVPKCGETKSDDIEDNSGEYKKNSSVFREVSIFLMALAVVMAI